jgi:hypothetical protein
MEGARMTRDYIPRQSEQIQRGWNVRWCLRCQDYAPKKGGTTKPVFLCEQHKPTKDVK